jgi:hypothetical protein
VSNYLCAYVPSILNKMSSCGWMGVIGHLVDRACTALLERSPVASSSCAAPERARLRPRCSPPMAFWLRSMAACEWRTDYMERNKKNDFTKYKYHE